MANAIISCKTDKDKLDTFKKLCGSAGVTPNMALSKLIDFCNNQADKTPILAIFKHG